MRNAEVVTYHAETRADRIYLDQLQQDRIALAREWQSRYAARQILHEARTVRMNPLAAALRRARC